MFIPPKKIHKKSCGTSMELESINKKDKTLLTYKYLDGILKGSTVVITETEVEKQLKNYWEAV